MRLTSLKHLGFHTFAEKEDQLRNMMITCWSEYMRFGKKILNELENDIDLETSSVLKHSSFGHNSICPLPTDYADIYGE